VQKYGELKKARKGLQENEEMAGGEDELAEMAQAEIEPLKARIATLEAEIKLLLVPKDPRDERDVIVEIRAGAGGDEAGLFAADLFRMYTRYAENHRWKVEVLDESESGIGGFKEVVFAVKGKGAYSRLKFESGVHRVQRIPATEANDRIHTSTITVAVLPEVDELEITIPDGDLLIETYRSRGAGGQNVQKNESAVRIRHIPTGIIVTCQDQRSQTQNRERAMHVLKVRLQEIEDRKREAELRQLKGEHVDAAFGNQVRNYVLHPYQLVKDTRTEHETSQTAAVLDGDLDAFMEAFLRMG
jgi:peptide chain release factor 1